MSEVADPDELPRARAVRARWPGLVWAIPLSALILVTVLGLHAFLNRGLHVVISFESVAGVKVGDTKVVYQGYEVGHVTKVDVERPGRINLTVTLDRRAEPVLRTGTVFWLEGVKPSLSDLSSVKGAIAGPTIGIAPSFAGKPTRHFEGLSEEPAVMPGTPGKRFALTAERIGAIQPRSSISYHGQEIGKVTTTAFVGPDDFRVGIFIYQPFVRLVGPGAVFWQAAPLQLSLGSGAVQANAVDPSALFSGAIEMDVVAPPPPPPRTPGVQFYLAGSRAAAEAGAPGPKVTYALTFPGTNGPLAGAPVTLLGFPVGRVSSRALTFDPSSGLPATMATVDLEPERLGAAVGIAADPAASRESADAIVMRLLARGYRAKLVQQPPIIGSYGVAFVRAASRGPARLLPGDPPRLPVAPGGADPGEQVQDILGKIDRMPIERIGRNLGAITDRLRTLVASPRLDDSLTHLHAALANVDQITAQVRPQVGPLVAKLRDAATQAAAAATAARGILAGEGGDPDASLPRAIQELTDMAGSMRALADELARHPEALIKGKGKGKGKSAGKPGKARR